MKAQAFIEAIRKVVLDASAVGVLSILQRPPGRKPAAELTELSGWYNALPEQDKATVERLIRMAVHHAVLGVLEVLDGVLKVDPSATTNDYFELRHIHADAEDILSGPKGEPLHELL